MTSEECRLLIPQYLSDQLTAAERKLFEAHLNANAELRMEVEELRSVWEGLKMLPEEQPSAAMRARFYQRLNALARDSRLSPQPRLGWWDRSWAKVLTVGAVFLAGIYMGRVSASQHASADELAQLRGQVQGLRQMIALSLLDRQSAASRLEGVSWSYQVDRPDREIVTALLTVLNHDPNVNVRLASLNALEKFGHDEAVRKALIESIPIQESPLVQISLIDVLVHVRDNDAARELRKLVGDTEANVAVRQRAQWGLAKLGFQ